MCVWWRGKDIAVSERIYTDTIKSPATVFGAVQRAELGQRVVIEVHHVTLRQCALRLHWWRSSLAHLVIIKRRYP
jgi:hypothetical protein